jgi:hypothetical protein
MKHGKESRSRWIHVAIATVLLSVYLIALGLLYPETYRFRFDPTTVEDYLHSQDIPYDVPDRLFMSDQDIHLAAGYLYATGHDPLTYNFQHMPFIKYLYGLASVFPGNPYIVQIALGGLLVVLTYILGAWGMKSRTVGAMGGLILVLDPLFLDLSTQAMLDVGQSVLTVAFITTVLLRPRWYAVQGLMLGLAAGSKFWSPVAVAFVLTLGYELWRDRRIAIGGIALRLAVAAGAYMALYIPSFLVYGVTRVLITQITILVYWLNHSVSAMPGANVLLFLTGWFRSWWEGHEWMRTVIWSPLWPVSFLAACALLTSRAPELARGFVAAVSRESGSSGRTRSSPVADRVPGPLHFITLFPIVYLLSLAIQAPFARYFVTLLPFLYLCFAWVTLFVYERARVVYADRLRK